MTEHTLAVSRTARYFTSGDDNSRDRWLVLHGYGELARDFVKHFANLDDIFVVAPEGLSRFYHARTRRVGASWMTREDREAEIFDYCRLLDKVYEETMGAGVFANVMGFSQGGHTACRWVSHGPSINRLVLWGSGMPNDLDETAFARSVRSGGLTFVIGSRDRFVDETSMTADLERARAIGIEANITRYDGEHAIDPTVLKELIAT